MSVVKSERTSENSENPTAARLDPGAHDKKVSTMLMTAFV